MSDLDVFRKALERIAASADVPLAKMPDFDQPNGWRDLAIDRINIARAALASATCNGGLQVGAEPWRKHYFDMAKAAGDLKAAVRPQLDAMSFADHVEVRKAFNDIAIVAGRALDHMQPKAAPSRREDQP